MFLLRSRSDAEAILAQAERSERAVVLGASFIGMEVAASLRERGLEVTVVGQEAAPFEKQLGRPRSVPHSSRCTSNAACNSASGARSRRCKASMTCISVVLEGGETLPADLVVIGFGVRPATVYVSGVDRNDDGSLSVDAGLRVADGLYAAGDIARFPLLGDGEPIRVEHWRVAEQHGRVAALNMLGQAIRVTRRCRCSGRSSISSVWTISAMPPTGTTSSCMAIWRSRNFSPTTSRTGQVWPPPGLDRDQDTAALIELLTMRRDWVPSALGDSPAKVLAAMA